MPWSAHPDGGHPPELDEVAAALDPVLVPLGFAAGQAGAGDATGQVIWCRGAERSLDGGCVDLVADLVRADGAWRLVDVRYDGFPSDRWHLDLERDVPVEQQLAGLAARLPELLR